MLWWPNHCAWHTRDHGEFLWRSDPPTAGQTPRIRSGYSTHPLWDRGATELFQRTKVVARPSRIQLQGFLLNSAAPRALTEGLWGLSLVGNGQWRWDQRRSKQFGLCLPQMSWLKLAIFGERPMSLSRLLQGNDSFHGMTCALTNRWHQWNRNGKLYADFFWSRGCWEFFLTWLWTFLQRRYWFHPAVTVGACWNLGGCEVKWDDGNQPKLLVILLDLWNSESHAQRSDKYLIFNIRSISKWSIPIHNSEISCYSDVVPITTESERSSLLSRGISGICGRWIPGRDVVPFRRDWTCCSKWLQMEQQGTKCEADGFRQLWFSLMA